MGNSKSAVVKAQNQPLPDSIWYKTPRGIPFPQRYRTSLRCCIQGNLVTGAIPGVYYVSGNSAYLPYNGGSWPGVIIASTFTLQPCGFSNLCTSTGPYNNWRCYSSQIRARLTSGSLADIITYTVTPGNTGSAVTGVADALAEPRTKSAMTQGGATQTQIRHKFNITDFLGIGPYAVRDDMVGLFSGSYNAAPTQQFRWNFAWTTSNNAALVAPASYEIEMLYDVEFFNLNAGALLDN
jgi:hypothetical protein